MKIRNILVIIGIAVVFVHSANAQVKADFSSDKLSGCSPISVSFTNKSTGSGTLTYSWDLGNGNTSVQKDAQAIYSSPGKYTVKLTVSNGSQTDTKTMVIRAFKNPSAAFTANNKVCTGQTVQFNDLSQLGDTTLKSWLWDFRTGTTKSEVNPTLVYTVAKKNDVLLTVTDNNNCQSSLEKKQYIDVVNKPAVSFKASPASACKVPTTVLFSNSSTGGGNLTYNWEFQSGATSSLKEPQYTYTAFGSYTVKLTVTSDYGCSDNLSIQAVTIGAVKASGTLTQAGKTIQTNGIVCAGDVDFQSTSTGVSSVLWDFGDGSTDFSSKGIHTYTNAGNYTVKLIASPGTTCADTSKWVLKVEKAIAEFTMTPDNSCQSPATVNFTNVSQNESSYLWTFPDGSTSTSQNTSHVFTTPGDKDDYVIHQPQTFEIKLQAKTTNGCISEKLKTFTIGRPTAMFSADTIQGCLPLKVNFTDKSISDSPIAIYTWEFGDNSSQTTSTGQINYVYSSSGIFKARLIITTNDVNNCKDTSNFITIRVGKIPHPKFKAETTTACSSTTVRLTDLTPAGDMVDFWQYSSMGTSINTCSTVANPDWKFRNETGNLSIKLLAGSNGCYHDTTISNVINNTGPIGTYTYDLNCSNPLTYNFSGVAKGATSYEWDFGDSGTDNVLTPVHTYAAGGNYLVKFITHNASCHDTVSQLIYVRPVNPQFTMKAKGCAGDNIVLAGSPSNVIPSVLCREKYLWNFNDQTPALYTDKDTIQHVFTNRGLFSVSLTTLYDNGCSQTVTKPLRIYQPFAGMKADKTFGCTPLPVTFTDTSKKDVNALLKWELDYGDGNLPVTISGGDSNTHEYAYSGNFTSTITVTDTMNCKSIFSLPVGTGDPTPQFINLSTTSVCAGSPIQFAYYEPEPDSVTWDFGDGIKVRQKLASLTNPVEHSYKNEGKYAVGLTVYKYGCSKSMVTASDFVKVQKASAAFTISDSVWNCYPKLIQFTPKFVSKETIGGHWTFENENNISDIDTSMHPQIYTYTYSSPGVYHPKLSIETSFHCVDTYSKDITISGPTGSFTANPAKACKGDEITLALKDTANLVKFEWDLGDGRVVQGNPVKFSYSTGGDKLIGLILYGRMENCKPVDTARYQIDNLKAKFSVANPYFCEKNNLSFVNTSIGQQSQTWNFGDGAISTAVSPGHVFSAGQFNVSLIANSSNGCADTAQQKLVVNPLPKLTVSNDTIICFGGTAVLNASGGDQIVWYPSSGVADSTIYHLLVKPSQSEYYKAKVTTSSTQCTNSDSVYVFVQQPPVIVMQPARDTTIHIGESITLNVSTQVPVSYVWSPNYSLSCVNCADPIAKPMTDTIYTIEVMDVNKCFKRNASVKILINKNIPLELPSAFTPSGEEKNRILSPKGFGIEELLEFKIYNRWGNLVFSSTDLSSGWDGKFQGKDQPIDTYIYTVTARMATPDGKGIIKTIKGTVLLMR
jgi:gliding motility-associated-like protein